jgi:hypothetical protein
MTMPTSGKNPYTRAVVAHDQEPDSAISGNARIAATFRCASQAVCPAILLFPAALSAEGNSPLRPASYEPFDGLEGRLRCVLR